MKPDLLNYIDDVVNERLTLLHERESDPTWKNESEDLKADTKEEIKKCNEVLNEIKQELFDHYIFSLKSRTISIYEKKYKDKEYLGEILFEYLELLEDTELGLCGIVETLEDRGVII